MNKERSSNLHYGNFNAVAIVEGVVYTEKREDAPSWPEVYDELFSCFPGAPPEAKELPMATVPAQKPIVPSLRQVMRKRRILNETGSITKAAAGAISG